MIFSCDYCQYQSTRKYNLNVHMNNKHGSQSTTSKAYTSHPHPYLSHSNQQVNTYPQRTPYMISNNLKYAEESTAPTKISVGPNGARPPTTVSVPQLRAGVQRGRSVSFANGPVAPTTVSVPPQR
jgi:hypothetical protein